MNRHPNARCVLVCVPEGRPRAAVCSADLRQMRASHRRALLTYCYYCYYCLLLLLLTITATTATTYCYY